MQKDQTNTLPIYFQAINSLKVNEEQTLDLFFQRLSQVLQSVIMDQDKFSQAEIILQAKLSNFGQMLMAKSLHYLTKYKKELLQVYLLLKSHLNGQKLESISLPSAIDETVMSDSGQSFTQPSNIASLYLVCSIFMPMLLKLMQSQQPEPIELTLCNPEAICYSFDFNHLNSIYVNEDQFLELVLDKPLRMMNKFPTLEGYDLYKDINLYELLDSPTCLVSSNLIDRNITNLIQAFNYSKIVYLHQLLNKRPLTNNALLNAIQRLDILKIFTNLSHPQGKQQTSKSFCLTLPISKKLFLKMRHLYQCLPPEVSPLTKYDILSFGSGQQFKTLFYRFATEDYWEHCPQSQFLQAYYLCNESNVQWISIPSQQYKRSCKIKFFSEEQIQYLCSYKFHACRGVQKKGDLVIVGQGHEYFWRVTKGYGAAVLAKWSILLKSKGQITKFINIVQSKQQQQLESSWKLDICYRRIILSYLSHQYLNLDGKIMKKLINFAKVSIISEQNCLSKLCRTFVRQVILKKISLPGKFRVCGLCGREIINIYAYLDSNVVCLWCLSEQISKADQSSKFQVNYMCKPSELDQFFKNIQSSIDQVSNALDQTQLNHVYEETFCEGKYLGCFQLKQCFGKSIKDQSYIQSHISNSLPNLQLHIFAKRNYFCTLDSAIKCYALMKCKSKDQYGQMRILFKYFAQNCLSEEQKVRIRQQIYNHYREDNYVLEALRIMAEGDANK